MWASMSRGRSRWLVAGLAVAVAACSGQNAATPNPSSAAPAVTAQPATSSPSEATASPTTPATPPPTAAPTAAPSPYAAGDLAAGSYLVDSIPPITFSVDSGWTSTRPDPDFFDLEKGPAYLAVLVVTLIFTDPQQTNFKVPDGMDPAAAAAKIAKNKGLKLTDPVPVTIGGVSGLEFDVTTKSPLIYSFIGGDHTGYFFSSDIKGRVRLVSVGGKLVAITTEAPPKQFDAVIGQVQPIIDGIAFP
jgi:hypothetical protein